VSVENRKRLALTIGDPDGIGPEITVRFLHLWAKNALSNAQQADLMVYGDISALHRMAGVLNLSLPNASEHLQYHAIEADQNDLSQNARCGHIAYDSLVAAVTAIAKGDADALLTGPISKENLHAANIPYEGHTEILQDLANQHFSKPSLQASYQSDMLFLFQQFRMLLLTRHVPLCKVGESMTFEGVCQSLKTLCEFLTQQAKIDHPKIAMLGVNPHAGESMGKGQQHDSTEEARILKPAIQEIQRLFPSVTITPPLAADGAFRGFKVDQPPYDAYVAAYHDQGLIPFKMMAGLQAVNVTIGLPFLRTSVSHGTAPDIAGKGLASEESLVAAYQAALGLLTT